jgi:hypothetical protein
VTTRQIAPKPRKKDGRRRAPNATEKIAAALLKIKVGAEGGYWLIPEPVRSEGTAAEICKAVQWDHIRRHAEGGDTRPQNIDPLLVATHAVKTNKIDKPEIAKGKRYGAKEEAFRARLLAKQSGQVIADAGKKPKRSSFAANRDGPYRKPFNKPAERRI